MSQHPLTIVLSLPDDGPNMDTIRKTARSLGLNLDGFISRAVVALTEQMEEDMADPRVQAWLSSVTSPTKPETR